MRISGFRLGFDDRVKIEIDERHIKRMADKALDSVGGSCKSGPVRVTLAASLKNEYLARFEPDNNLLDRKPMELTVKAFGIAGARIIARNKFEKAMADDDRHGYRVRMNEVHVVLKE